MWLYMHIYIYTFSRLFSIIGYYKTLSVVHCTLQKALVVYYFMYVAYRLRTPYCFAKRNNNIVRATTAQNFPTQLCANFGFRDLLPLPRKKPFAQANGSDSWQSLSQTRGKALSVVWERSFDRSSYVKGFSAYLKYLLSIASSVLPYNALNFSWEPWSCLWYL